jgi:hypothetical protein
MTRFHDRTLALLGSDAPRPGRNIEALLEWARRSDVQLPAAFVEWARMDDGSLLRKFSNDDWFWFDEPELVGTTDGVRGLKFNSENQNNFDRIVALDHGDDPPVLFAWIGQPPWVTNAARFSDAIYAQVFDWQYWLEFDPDDPEHKEMACAGEITLKHTRCLSLLRERYEEVVTTRFVVEGVSYAEHRFIQSPTLRMTATVDIHGAGDIRITGRDIEDVRALEAELQAHLAAEGLT